MYDIIYEFINNSLLNTTQNTYNLASILSVVSIILIYTFFVKLLIFVGSFFRV